MTSLNAATIEIVRCYLMSAAAEMRATLVRTAFNPIIYEVRDFGISIYDSNIECIAVAPGLAIFTSGNDLSVPRAIEHVGADNLDRGDIILMNYPYWNAGHTSDATLVAPVFVPSRSRPVAYLCVRAHWADLGAKDLGYVVDSTDVFQEGLIFPGTKIYKAGRPNEDVIDILRFNSRMPELVLGDLNAQVAAMRTGEPRIVELFTKFGADVVEQAIAAVIANGEDQARQRLTELPQGSWTAVTHLDGDGIDETPLKLQATVTNADGQLQIDFTGSHGAARGPVNLPFGSTVAMCKLALKALTTPYVPANAGHTRPLTVIAEPGNIFHAVPPSPTFTQWAAQVGLQLIFSALAIGMPDHVQAPSGGDGMGVMTVGRRPDTGALYALSSSEPCGWGAVVDHDGSSGLQFPERAIMRNTPIEVLESKTGLLIEGLAFRQDSGGAGQFRGGVGVERHLRALHSSQMLSLTKTMRVFADGVAGGGAGQPNTSIVYAGSDKERRVGTYRIDVEPGDRVVVMSAGGGGHGDPLTRDRDAVLEDVREGYISSAAASEIYGLDVSGSGPQLGERVGDPADTATTSLSSL